ncbi:MAG: hypothetical protein JSW71_01615 [Gemmatimonadota bacterium]|nr:MAG: hypothetical protein JSW71_01615 [Gemmatimonadota bacterium]
MSQIANHITSVRIVAVAIAAVLVLAAACPVNENDPTSSSTEPRPTTLAVIGGNNQQDIVGQLLAEDLVVRLEDQSGNTMANQTVSFTVVQGGGTVGSASVTTDGDGLASTTWTLGSTAGAQEVRAAVPDASPTATFSASALADSPSSVAASAGNQQQGFVGYPLDASPAVTVSDQFGNPVAGVEVTFAVTVGGGSVTGPIDTTGVDGTAAVGSWILGSAGTNNLTATVTGSGLTGNPVTFTAIGVTTLFDIEVRYSDSSLVPTTAQQQAFDGAVTRWQSLVVGDVANQALSTVPAGTCAGAWHPDLSGQTVDDLVIYVTLDSIDGAYGVLGQAGPCMIRTGSGLPVLGGMRFDVSDLTRLETNGELQLVILHEMGHVLGFGTLWPTSTFNLLQSPSDTAPAAIVDSYFSGAAAIAAFDSISTSPYTAGEKVPVENDNTRFGVGSLNGHWRESVFDSELMTPQFNSGVPNELSAVTVASLEDMGYQVVRAFSDSYAWPAPAAVAAARASSATVMVDDIWLGPIRVLDEGGRVIGVVRR